jgi:hypothetical protein
MIVPVASAPSFTRDVFRAALRSALVGVVLALGLRQGAWFWVGLMTLPVALVEQRVERRPVLLFPPFVTPAIVFGLGVVALLAGLLQATYLETMLRARSFEAALSSTSELVAALRGPYVRGGLWDRYLVSWSPLWEWWESPRCPIDTALAFGTILALVFPLRWCLERVHLPEAGPASRVFVLGLFGACLGLFTTFFFNPGEPPRVGRFTSLQGFEEGCAYAWFGALAGGSQSVAAYVTNIFLACVAGPFAEKPTSVRFSAGRALVVALLVTVGLSELLASEPGFLSRGYARGVAFTWDGDLVGAAVDQDLELWTVDGESSVRTGPVGGTAFAFTPDGKLGVGASVLGDRVELWTVPGGSPVRTLEAGCGRREFEAYAVAFSPDGRWLVVGGAPGGRVYSVADGARAHVLADPDTPMLRLNSVAVTTSRIAATTLEGPWRIWELATGVEVARFTLPGAFGASSSVAASPAGDRFAWATGNGVAITTSSGVVSAVSSALPGGAGTCAFSPDGQFVVVGCRKSLCILSAADASIVREVPGLREWALGVAWSPRGDTLASASGSGVQLYRLGQGR